MTDRVKPFIIISDLLDLSESNTCILFPVAHICFTSVASAFSISLIAFMSLSFVCS